MDIIALDELSARNIKFNVFLVLVHPLIVIVAQVTERIYHIVIVRSDITIIIKLSAHNVK